jgi:hypothetical protein
MPVSNVVFLSPACCDFVTPVTYQLLRRVYQDKQRAMRSNGINRVWGQKDVNPRI